MAADPLCVTCQGIDFQSLVYWVNNDDDTTDSDNEMIDSDDDIIDSDDRGDGKLISLRTMDSLIERAATCRFCAGRGRSDTAD